MAQSEKRDSSATPEATAIFVDVGQGDCTVVVDNDTNHALLVDCPSASVEKLRKILTARSLTLKTLIITHWDLDHYGGIARVLEFAPDASIYYNIQFWQLNSTDGRLRSAMRQITSRDNSHELLRNAEAPASGSVGTAVRWKLLAPTHAEVTASSLNGNRNDSSVVVDIAAGQSRILVGGDATPEIWKRLLTTPELSSPADILRWPHHGALLGNEGELGRRLVDALHPDYVVISVGTKNRYGHPHKITVTSASTTARVLCTQLGSQCHAEPANRGPMPCAGTVTAESIGGSLSVTPANSVHDQVINKWGHPMCR